MVDDWLGIAKKGADMKFASSTKHSWGKTSDLTFWFSLPDICHVLVEKVSLLLVINFVLQLSVAADDWPQWRGLNRDGNWFETGIIEEFNEFQPEIQWRIPIGSGYSGPTVAGGYVYLADRVASPVQVERVHCFDSKTGALIWSFKYECIYKNVDYVAGPRASVTINDGLAYALGTMGHLHCFNAVTGEVLWKKNLNYDYNIRMPVWGISGSPVIEKDLVIVQIGGTPEACIVGLDRRTGEERWTALADRASYSSPIVIDQADKRVLVCWTGDNVVGLNPQDGQQYWKYPFPPSRMVIGIATPVFYNHQLLISDFFEGTLLLNVEPDRLAVQKIWHRKGADEINTDCLHSIISTPIYIGDHIYGVDSYGEVRCIEASSGDRIWEDLTIVPKARWSTAHFVKNRDKVWIFNERGELLLCTLSPQGAEVIDRMQLIQPTKDQLNRRGGVCWSHPAFAYKCVFVRNDQELLCASLEK